MSLDDLAPPTARVENVDVIVIGGGPAGLSAALVLGRALRRVVVCDDGHPRNEQVSMTHGLLTRDGTDPAELRHIGMAELERYPSVTVAPNRVVAISGANDRFHVNLDDGDTLNARRVLLCHGVIDVLPALEGLAERWGRSIFNCPYCSAWEVREKPLIVLGADEGHAYLACHLKHWSDEVAICTGGCELELQLEQLLARQGVKVFTSPVIRMEGPGDTLERVVFADGSSVECNAAFLQPQTKKPVALADQLGCTQFEDGSLRVDEFGQTSVPGVHAAGDCCRRDGMPKPGSKIAISIGQAVAAAIAIDQFLFLEDLTSATPTR